MTILRTTIILISAVGVILGIGYIPDWKAQVLAFTFFGVFGISALWAAIEDQDE